MQGSMRIDANTALQFVCSAVANLGVIGETAVQFVEKGINRALIVRVLQHSVHVTRHRIAWSGRTSR